VVTNEPFVVVTNELFVGERTFVAALEFLHSAGLKAQAYSVLS